MSSRTALHSLRLSAVVFGLAFTGGLFAQNQSPQTPPAQAPSAQAPAATVGIAPEQTPAPQLAGAPTIRVTAREVLLDVLVVDKSGQPVTGLNASDFNVSEQGQAQVIRRLSEHHAMSADEMNKLASAPELPPNTFSNYTPARNTNASIVLLLDAMDSPIQAQMVMRQQLINFLKHMQPGPPVAIFQLDTEMRLIQGFTSDPKVLLSAAESKRDMPTMAPVTAAPRSYSADAVYRRTLMENLRSGMRMLGGYLAAYPGRKNLIWFTGRIPMTRTGYGFGDPFRDGMTVTGGGDEASELTDVLMVSRIAVYPVDTFGLVAPGSMGAASRRPGMMTGIPGFDNHANMDEIAQQTGGKAYYNTNDFTRVIEDVIRTGSSYYSIAYGTTNTKWNGEFRSIKVTVDRPNVQLQHKNGYYAYNFDAREQAGIAAIEKRMADQVEQQESVGAAIDQPPVGTQEAGATANPAALGATIHHSTNGGFGAAMGLGSIPPTEIVFAARLQADANTEKLNKSDTIPQDNFLKPEWQHKPFRNYAIFYDADVHKIRFTRTPDGMRHASIEFVAIVYTGDGEEVNSIIQTATLDMTADHYSELLVSGLHTKAEIAIPVKGNFFLRLGVHDKVGDQVGALEIPVDQIRLDVPAASAQNQ
ncbi:MAG: VWA domain-containing protein [Terracidiphilus sp.]|jgi:VWFA-related protein